MLLGCAIALAGCASVPASQAPRRLAAVPATCLHGASSIAPRNFCTTNSRAYTGRQLRETGYTNVAQALQALDPAITAVGAH